jgi:hypothetical protein
MKSVVPFRRIRTEDRILEMIQDNISESIHPVNASEILPGVFVGDVTLTVSVDNLIAHKLGRMPKMWVIVGKNADANVWQSNTIVLSNQSITDKFLNLKTSANCKVSLWVC